MYTAGDPMLEVRELLIKAFATAWRAGDRVVLLRDHGGQQFYLLGRM